jgi:hypothetical protein
MLYVIVFFRGFADVDTDMLTYLTIPHDAR